MATEDSSPTEPSEPGTKRSSRRLWVLVAVAVALAAVGLRWHFPSAKRLYIEDRFSDVLARAESWELISLGTKHPPSLANIQEGDPMPPELFHWKGVLGRKVIDDPDIRSTLTRAFNRGRGRWIEVSFMCFAPRHAISASLPSGERVDVLICFQCESYKIYDESGRPVGRGDLTKAPRETFNRVYREHGLQIAP